MVLHGQMLVRWRQALQLRFSWFSANPAFDGQSQDVELVELVVVEKTT